MIEVSGVILFIAATFIKANTQVMKIITEIKKYKTGTKIILFVLAKKSAEASMTSIASFKDLNPQQMHVKKSKARIPRIITPARQYF